MSQDTLAGRKLLVALTGGIACYKAAAVVSKLVQQGADVRVLMTDAATRFITPLTLQSLSGHPVLTSMWQHDDRPDSQHVGLARWCDAMLIAPCSANTLARLATGLCDNLVTLTACALPKATPLLLAPAMNADMWQNPITQRNLQTLRDTLPNLHLIGPEEGWQACRTRGPGRMSEPEVIVSAISQKLNRRGAESAEKNPDLDRFTRLIQRDKTVPINQIIESRPGLYSIFVDDPQSLPAPFGPELQRRKTTLIYIGRTKRALSLRIQSGHIRQGELSTFFFSLGVALGYTPEAVPRKNGIPYPRFRIKDANAIADWASQHLLAQVEPCTSDESTFLEIDLIAKHRPLFNLLHNPQKFEPLSAKRRLLRSRS